MRIIVLVAIFGLIGGCAQTSRDDIEEFAPIDLSMYGVHKPQVGTGTIYNAQSNRPLFEDVRAGRLGDIIVVQLVEQTDAEKSSNTTIAKNTSNTVADPILAGNQKVIGKDNNLSFNLNSDHEFSGAAGSNQSNRLRGTIAVTVTAVLPNGNLLIEGEKWVKINRGKEYIRLRGLIRPIDVGSDNAIVSTRIANAEIFYGGKGELAQSNSPGWLSRFFISPLWPF
ncbi:MAG: flagellar L-ring protein precursor FlgH [Candidatus Azotimanducaceae bacterium]|jgi:flagellar L-ring protein precursor FlgH